MGSIIIIFKSEGENLYSIEIINPFIQTDFQLAVCHATSKCGIFVISHTIISQDTSFQTAIGISIFGFLKIEDEITSFKKTACLLSFGTSIHTTHSPGIGACIRIDLACKARVRSFLRFTILFNFTQSSGLSLY